jgi:hypothetical protein
MAMSLVFQKIGSNTFMDFMSEVIRKAVELLILP